MDKLLVFCTLSCLAMLPMLIGATSLQPSSSGPPVLVLEEATLIIGSTTHVIEDLTYTLDTWPLGVVSSLLSPPTKVPAPPAPAQTPILLAPPPPPPTPVATTTSGGSNFGSDWSNDWGSDTYTPYTAQTLAPDAATQAPDI